MARKHLARNPITDSEEMRCCMYGTFGGPHASLIAKKLYGNGDPNYVPSAGEISRVYRILRRNKISLRDWRNGNTEESQRFFNRLGRVRSSATPKLRIVA